MMRLLLLLVLLPATAYGQVIDFTNQGTRFGYSQRQAYPQNVIITLSGSLEDGFHPVYTIPTPPETLRVSIDLPGHGQDTRPGEPGGLWTWLHRINYGEDVVGYAYSKLADVVYELRARGWVDHDRVMVVGFSRGAFIALHSVRQGLPISVIGVLPVTDLAALTEFAGTEHWSYIQATKLSVLNTTEQVWLIAGNTDTRVDSARTVALQRATSALNPTSRMELHLVPTNNHAAPAVAYTLAADWILRVWAQPNGGR